MSQILLVALILGGMSLTWLLEAWLEAIVIQLKDGSLENYAQLDAQEHARSWILAAAIATPWALICLHFGLYWILGALAINRRLVFDPMLKKFRRRKLALYEGSGGVDKAMARIFGRNGAVLEILLELAVTAVFIYLQTV